MEVYANNNRNSGVAEYQKGTDYLIVKFKTNKIYKYTYMSASQYSIEEMKKLADDGSGLGTYINKNKPGFES